MADEESPDDQPDDSEAPEESPATDDPATGGDAAEPADPSGASTPADASGDVPGEDADRERDTTDEGADREDGGESAEPAAGETATADADTDQTDTAERPGASTDEGAFVPTPRDEPIGDGWTDDPEDEGSDERAGGDAEDGDTEDGAPDRATVEGGDGERPRENPFDPDWSADESDVEWEPSDDGTTDGTTGASDEADDGEAESWETGDTYRTWDEVDQEYDEGLGPEATSDGGYAGTVGDAAGAGAGATGTGTGTGWGEGGVHGGAPDDEEMPLADHIEEMVRRLGVVLVVMAVVSGVVFPFGEDLINFLWYSFLPGSVEACPEGVGRAACPRVYQPLALVLARLKVATLAGFIIALPVFVYETYLFMRPGLFPEERRYYLASVPTSLVLAGIGVVFAYYLVLPAIFAYFVRYSEDVTVLAFGLTETFNLIVMLLGFFAVVFQIPLFVMLAIMMGLTTRQWLVDRRLYFWGAFLGIAFLFSPDPTGMAPIIVAATMVGLFEGTLLLLRWTRHR